MGRIFLRRIYFQKFKDMKIAATLIASALADSQVCWPANDNMDTCGCQLIYENSYSMINSTCTLNFKVKPYHLQVASSFAVGFSEGIENLYSYTGFEGLSDPTGQNVVVFWEREYCQDAMTGEDLLNSTENLGNYFNGLTCQDNGEALAGVYLGSFVHDYERSTQNYNVAIKGLQHDDVAIVDFNDFDNSLLAVQNVSAHGGHGTAFTQEECPSSTQAIFQHDRDHHGELEYFQFSNCDNGLNSRVASNWHTTVIVQ